MEGERGLVEIGNVDEVREGQDSTETLHISLKINGPKVLIVARLSL